MTRVTYSELKLLLEYFPQTGDFVYRRQAGPRPQGKVAGWIGKQGYRLIFIRGKAYAAHRLAFLYINEAWPNGIVDHKNGIRSDNRWVNLRDVDHRINGQNRKAIASYNRSSGLLGVTRKGARWQAKIKVNGKSHYLGLFETKEKAHAAYLCEKRRSHEGNTL